MEVPTLAPSPLWVGWDRTGPQLWGRPTTKTRTSTRRYPARTRLSPRQSRQARTEMPPRDQCGTSHPAGDGQHRLRDPGPASSSMKVSAMPSGPRWTPPRKGIADTSLTTRRIRHARRRSHLSAPGPERGANAMPFDPSNLNTGSTFHVQPQAGPVQPQGGPGRPPRSTSISIWATPCPTSASSSGTSSRATCPASAARSARASRRRSGRRSRPTSPAPTSTAPAPGRAGWRARRWRSASGRAAA